MWRCVKCREMLEDTFEVCWNCGTSKDGTPDPDFSKEPDEVGSAERGAVPQETAERNEAVRISAKCAKCGSALEEGFVHDMTPGGNTPATWVEGQPEWSFWRGTKVLGKERYRIQAFRCTKCGLVELYAK